MDSFFRIIEMLIYWGGGSFDDDFHSNEKEFMQIASELLRSRRKGHQLIVIEPDLCDKLVNLNFSDMEKAIIRKISDEYTQTGAAIDTMRPAIVIAASASASITVDDGIYNIPFRLLERSRVLESSVLVVENGERDGFLLGVALNHKKLHPIMYEIVHGGGADILDVFEAQLKRKGIVACTVDSDKYTPHSLKNEKLSGLQTRMKREEWPLAFPFSPNCREIENMIPPSIVFSLPSASSSESIEAIKLIVHNQAGDVSLCFWNYFDIKDGVIHGKALKLKADERDWLESRLSLAGISIIDEGDSRLGDNPKEYKYITGFGSKVIDQIRKRSSVISDLLAYMEDPRWVVAFSTVITSLCSIFSSSQPLDVYS